MAYDEPSYRRRGTDNKDPDGGRTPDDSRFGGSTYRDDPEYGHRTTGSAGRHEVSTTQLNDVFDDPAHGEPGRDRLGVHIAWEVVLLVAAGVLAFLLYLADPAALRGGALNALLVDATAIGLLAIGAGLSLRTAAPNLALGPVAIAAALHFAENGDRGVVQAMLPAILAAAALGLAVAVLVVGLHVPSWAASLAAALGAIVFIQQRSTPVALQGEFDPKRSAFYLFGGFAAVAVLGGLFGTIKPLRRASGRFRPVGDPARRRGGVAGTFAAVAIVVSMVLAMLAGVLIAVSGNGPVSPSPGVEWTGLAIGAALLGGTSAFGRRGGIFGTLLSVVLLTLFIRYADERSWHIALTAVAAVAVVGGLLVTRLVETFGRPRSPVTEPGEEWQAESGPVSPSSWSGGRTDGSNSWPTMPTQPTEARGDPWGTDRWGASDR
jgi:ribose/xylose/arabinose/galactoside ABC-type transport system permease subunit